MNANRRLRSVDDASQSISRRLACAQIRAGTATASISACIAAHSENHAGTRPLEMLSMGIRIPAEDSGRVSGRKPRCPVSRPGGLSCHVPQSAPRAREPRPAHQPFPPGAGLSSEACRARRPHLFPESRPRSSDPCCRYQVVVTSRGPSGLSSPRPMTCGWSRGRRAVRWRTIITAIQSV